MCLHRQNLLCDVTLVADSIEVPAHKMVLAACSPYFSAMFTSFEESKQERITLQGVDSQALQLLVEYVYSSEVHVTEENVQVCYKIKMYCFLWHLRVFHLKWNPN
jgi:kelch-like protein 2/3